jgi:hypothetical protein
MGACCDKSQNRDVDVSYTVAEADRKLDESNSQINKKQENTHIVETQVVRK